eukprot:3332692-Prymnesium_polylepis.1
MPRAGPRGRPAAGDRARGAARADDARGRRRLRHGQAGAAAGATRSERVGVRPRGGGTAAPRELTT